MGERLKMNLARHELLKCSLDSKIDDWVATYWRDLVGIAHYAADKNLRLCMAGDLHAVLGIVSIAHLQYTLPSEWTKALTTGVDVFVAYFTTDWWKVDEKYGKKMDKEADPNSYDLYWFDEFRTGLFLALLTERWDDIAAACDWVDPHLNPEFQGEGFQYELVSVYKLIAAVLRPRPMEDKAKLQDEVLSSRHTRPKYLLKSLMAAESGNEADFGKFLLKALGRFRASKVEKHAAPDWVADPESVVAMTGMRLGMTLPELIPEEDAVLVTRASLGLE